MNDLAWEPDAPSAAHTYPCPTFSLLFVQTSPPQWEQYGHSSGCDLSVAYLLADAKSSSHEVIYIAPTLYFGPCDNNRLSWSRYFESILCCNCTSVPWTWRQRGNPEKGPEGRGSHQAEVMFAMTWAYVTSFLGLSSSCKATTEMVSVSHNCPLVCTFSYFFLRKAGNQTLWKFLTDWRL